MSAKPNPLPWRQNESGSKIEDAGGEFLAIVQRHDSADESDCQGCINGALIVRAVNAHEALAASCAEILPRLAEGDFYDDYDRATAMVGRLRAALAIARGEGEARP